MILTFRSDDWDTYLMDYNDPHREPEECPKHRCDAGHFPLALPPPDRDEREETKEQNQNLDHQHGLRFTPDEGF